MFLLFLACTKGDADTADVDLDGDGFRSSVDCDDHDLATFPGAAETCNGVDDDCDGETDEGVQLTFFRDTDGDGYGDPDNTTEACELDSGYVEDNTDCDDTQALFNPGADEDDCTDPTDYNCDGSVGYEDADGDGHPACQDCDDRNADRNPDAEELCNLLDDDCDGTVDQDASDALTWYADADADGYGDAEQTQERCERPYGYVDNAQDCDDTNAQANPGVWEVCNGVDDDCDGDADESAIDATEWYLDADEDGYGDSAVVSEDCDAPSGYVDDDNDCDDADEDINPGINESCDEVDNDCDGDVDEDDAIDATTWYSDVDGDGYGLSSTSTVSCEQPSNYVEDDGDCLDSDADVYPGNGCEADCLELYNDGNTTDGTYSIDPDGAGSGEDAIDVYCDMTSDGGGWTLCASLTKGYVPADMLYNQDMYAFQARANGDQDYVLETDAPSASTSSWNNSEALNYGQFCRHMDNVAISETWINAKLYNYANNCASSWAGRSYDKNYTAVYTGNLFTQWFTNTNASRSFSKVSGDTLTVNSNDNTYGGAYTTPTVTFGSSQTHSSNPWGDASGSCVGCTSSSSCYGVLPYGQTTILNNTGHSFWSGISNIKYGWSDCTANGNCNYHESGYGVWLFYVR